MSAAVQNAHDAGGVAAEGAALRLFSRGVAALASLAMSLAAVSLLLSLVLIAWAVVMRYALHRAPAWVDDIVGFALVAIVMLAASDTLRRRQHIGVDLLVGRLTGRARRWADAWSALATIAIALLFVVNGWAGAMFAKTLGMVTEGQLEWPTWCLMLLMPLGGVLLLLTAVEQLWRAVAGPSTAQAPVSHGMPATPEEAL